MAQTDGWIPHILGKERENFRSVKEVKLSNLIKGIY